MNAYMICMGSMGDTLPFVTIGEAMAARGHRVTIVANEHFREFIEKRNLVFAPTLSKDRYQQFIDSQKKQSSLASLREMGEMLRNLIEPVYRLLEEQYIPGQTVACAQTYAMGARVARDVGRAPRDSVFSAHVVP